MMSIVKIKDKTFKTSITEEEIKTIRELSEKIANNLEMKK